MTFRQNRFPFSAAVAPVPGVEPMLFNEQCDAGEGGNWAIVPGISAPFVGTQLAPAGYAVWDPGAAAPPGGSSFIDTSRGALVTGAGVPPVEYQWTGLTRRTVPDWAPDADAFLLQWFTRVGLVNQFSAPPLAAGAGYGGTIISLEDLAGAVDGAFISLGIHEGENGPEAQVSKWSGYETLVQSYTAPVASPSVFLRALIEVDAEDGLTVQFPEWSVDGWAWQLFGGDLLLERQGNTRLTVGFGATGYTDGAAFNQSITSVVDSLQLFGPYADNSNSEFRLRVLTPGGRNWP